MAVRKFSSRHIRFKMARTLVRIVPGLRGWMPIYDEVRPMLEVGRVETIRGAQDIMLDAEAAALANKMPNTIPPRLERSVHLITLENATVLGSTGAVLDEAREHLLIPRGARNGALNYASYHDFRPVFSRVVKRPGGIYFNMMGSHRGHRHYYHFMFDRVPRLYYLLNEFDVGGEQITVLTNTDLPTFQRDIYRFIQQRHPNLQFAPVPPNERWRIRHLLHVDDHQPIKRTLAAPKLLEWIRSLVFDGYGIAQAAGACRRIYVSRKDTRRRRVANELALLPILTKYGFEVVAPGTLPFADQIGLFAGAGVIAGPHGAGLTNILFAPRQGKVLELFPANAVRSDYFLLSVSLGLTYRALIGGEGGRKDWFDVDPEQLDSRLHALFGEG
jgi:capsular polysaccharide biosynthesis protein